MLQGRVAPPPSPAVVRDDASGAHPSRPSATQLPSISRRNSFSRDMATSISQIRSQSFGNASPLDSIKLHVNDRLRALSPRKSASFTLPKSPFRDSSGVSHEVSRMLRSTYSEYPLRNDARDGVQRHIDLQCEEILNVSDAPSLLLDSPLESSQSSDGDDDLPASPSSSAYSPVSPSRHDGFADDNILDSWLHDTHAVDVVDAVLPVQQDDGGGESSLPRAPKQLSSWLQRDHMPPCIQLSTSVQQIEMEIRQAMDSASFRDSLGHQPRDSSLDDHKASTMTVSADHPEENLQPVHQEEPELLVLMEVLIGDGRSETIEVHVGDEPQQLAEHFVKKHGLPSDTVPKLTLHIQEQLGALEEEDAATEQVLPLPPSQNRDEWLHKESSVERALPCHRHDEAELPPMAQPPPAPMAFENTPTYAQCIPSQHHQLPHTSREFEREHSYNHLMEKYGHYTSHTNKVDPSHTCNSAERAASRGAGKDRTNEESNEEGRNEPLTARNLQFSEHSRLLYTPRPVAFTSSGKSHNLKDKDTVYNRLYSLAEAREKWIRRQQKTKAAEEMKEAQAVMKLEISAKSRDMVAGRNNGGFAHIGERLYEEALNDMAKKQLQRERREREKSQQVDWTCPKCAFLNQYNDTMCKNVVAATTPTRRSTVTSLNGATDTPRGAVCGHPRPTELFRPTLIATTTTSSQKKVRAASHSQSQRRQRTQQQMEEEFRQTCPFKPKINEMSAEIMRDKLEHEARSMGASVTTTKAGEVRRKNPHQALYEDAFHSRAQREAKEQEYLRQFPFKPDIGVNALWSNRDGDDVVERLAVSKYHELERKRQSLYEKYAPDRDPTTGREFFKPETGRAPIFNRNERGLRIGDFLYEAHKEQAEYHWKLKQQDMDQIREQSEQRFLSDKSKQALEARKTRTFARLFDYLVKVQRPRENDAGDVGRDEEPQILPSNVDVAALPTEITRVVSILFEFANHETFTFVQFECYMNKLMRDVPGLTHTEVLFITDALDDGKSARRSFEKPNGDDGELRDSELTFRPAIDKNSAALAQKHGRADRARVYEALNQYFDHYKERKEQARKQREREFERTHPFQPTFYTKDRKAKASAFYEKMQARAGEADHGSHNKDTAEAPALRTSMSNARPFVRPIDLHHVVAVCDSSPQQLRSRSSSLTSSKHSDDEDAVLTSRVLAALDDRATSPSTTGSAHSAFSTLFPSTATASSSPSLVTSPTSSTALESCGDHYGV